MQGLPAPTLNPESELRAGALASVVVLRDPANQVTGRDLASVFSLLTSGGLMRVRRSRITCQHVMAMLRSSAIEIYQVLQLRLQILAPGIFWLSVA